MDELNKQNVEEESAAAQPGGESAQSVPPAGTGAQQAQQPEGEGTTAPETQLGKLVCPRCGNAFEPKEKKCPHCGMKNNLKLCKTCGATIAKNAKRCPKCGAKNKKPIYKRVWFWILIVLLSLRVYSGISNLIKPDKAESTVTEVSTSDAKETAQPLSEEDKALVGTWSAVRIFILDEKKSSTMDAGELEAEFKSDHTGKLITAENGTTSFTWSYDGTSDQNDKVYKAGDTTVTIIGYRSDLSQYAGDIMITSDMNTLFILEPKKEGEVTGTASIPKSTSNTQKAETSTEYVSEGKKNALAQANSYLNAMAFSYTGLREQLEYEGYSTEEATYAVDNCGAHWSEQAVRKAEEYLKSMPFSKSSLIEQLEYEGFTHEQAVYGADQAY